MAFHWEHPLEGYRRLTYMMMDADVVAASPATVYRILKAAGCFARWNRSESTKRQGIPAAFAAARALARGHQLRQHLRHVLLPHQRFGWLQPLSRPLGAARINARIRRRDRAAAGPGNVPRRKAADHHRQRPTVHRPRLPSFSPPLGHDPRQNEPLLSAEQWQDRTLARHAQARLPAPNVPLSLEDARRLVEDFVNHYNHERLHSAIGYITPADMLAGRAAEIFAERDRKLEAARERRRSARQLASTAADALQHQTTWAEDRATQRCDPSAVPGVGVKRCAGPPIGASPIPSLQHQCAKPDWHDATVYHWHDALNSLTPKGQNSSSR